LTDSSDRPRVLAILQARMSSTRLPGKVLADLVGAPMIVRQLERIRQSRLVDDLVVATSTDPSDAILAKVVEENRTRVARGSLNDVLDRYTTIAREVMPGHVVRLTGDCPLVDPDLVDAVIAHHIESRADITSNAYQPTFPDGLDVEVIRTEVLLSAGEQAKSPVEREHVTPYIYDPKHGYRVVHYRAPVDHSGLRWTVDEPEDLAFVREIFAALFPANPHFRMNHVLQLLKERPELSALNMRFTRNAGLAKSIAEEEAARRSEEPS
jgi:spore coat polysaccharide biosynthesis protein SpsF